jgi:GntR family transcriptional repressor for pyruvate dehydrogenase complex
LKKTTQYVNPFNSVQKRKIYDEVYDQLISLISKGSLKPGEQLPPERLLAKELKVSRQSIREALKKAETKGLISVRQGEGTFVLSAVSDWMEAPLILMMSEEVKRVYEFLEIRKLIELWCARKAAEVATPRDLKKMEKALLEMDKLRDSPGTLGQPDIDFHIAIAEASRNTLMVHMMTSVRQIFSTMFKISAFTRPPGKNRILIKQHREIYGAIESRDPDRARHTMEKHLAFVESEWTEDIRRRRVLEKHKISSR